MDFSKIRKVVKNWVENLLTVSRAYGIIPLVVTNDSATSLPEWLGRSRDPRKDPLDKAVKVCDNQSAIAARQARVVLLSVVEA
jgi:hypothetical protein